MDIIKAFENNELTHHVTIHGSHEEPLFRASDIGEVLEITHIRTSIQDFDNSEKNGVRITDIMGREQETTFLTEKGLYKLLFKSRKPIAKKFTDWVCEIIKEIRLNGKYQLEKQLEDSDLKLKESEENLNRKQEIIEELTGSKYVFNMVDYANKEVIYLIHIKGITYKYGITQNFLKRLTTHNRELSRDIKVIKCWDAINRTVSKRIEDAIYSYVEHRYIKGTFENQTEIIETDNIDLVIKKIDDFVIYFSEEHYKIYRDENLKLIHDLVREVNKAGCTIKQEHMNSLLGSLPQIKEIKNKDFEELTLVRNKTHMIFHDDIPYRIPCNTCGIKITTDEFGINEVSKEIYKNCKTCRGKMVEYDKKRRPTVTKTEEPEESEPESEEPEESEENTGNKCSIRHCKVIIKNGTHKYCENCRKKERERYEKNKEKKLQNKKEYYEKNKEQIRLDQKEYYNNNASEIIQKKKSTKKTIKN